MKKYHKILLIVLCCLGGVYGAQAQTNLFRLTNEQSNFAITLKQQTAPQPVASAARSRENNLSQFFIIERLSNQIVVIRSAANPSLYLGRNSEGKLVFDLKATLGDANTQWSIDFAGIGTIAGKKGFFVLSVPSDATKVAMINDDYSFQVVNVSGGLPAGQQGKFRFLLEQKANTF